jgi:four helix bundle protein
MNWCDLKIWEKSHELVIDVYEASGDMPSDEKFGLISQIRRAAYSIPVNIVEGHSRKSSKEYLKFLYISRGSLEELRYLILLCRDLRFLDEVRYAKIHKKTEEISKMINSLIKSIVKKIAMI